ncbi:hypothetical protein [Anoxynatronum sibiricum]|uniref:DUF1097 domain-containing protein n=1 Tax=Anoxynatronum sibiricum TaxID=210623 RepID=A0ABU9VVT5_9CLOT
MSKKFLFVLATVVTVFISIFCIIWAAVFGFDPANPQNMSPLFNLLWCAFAGLGLVVAQQGSFKTLPNMLCSAAVGPLYGMIFFGLLGVLMSNGVSALVAFGICALAVTYLLALLHVVVLEKTYFNAVAMTLGTYGIWFALKDPGDPTNYNWLYGAVFFLIGTAYGTIFVPITVFVMSKISKPDEISIEAAE